MGDKMIATSKNNEIYAFFIIWFISTIHYLDVESRDWMSVGFPMLKVLIVIGITAILSSIILLLSLIVLRSIPSATRGVFLFRSWVCLLLLCVPFLVKWITHGNNLFTSYNMILNESKLFAWLDVTYYFIVVIAIFLICRMLSKFAISMKISFVYVLFIASIITIFIVVRSLMLLRYGA